MSDVQNLLLRNGNSLTVYGADGQFGGETAAALINFQKKNALPVSGIADAQTLHALDEAAPASPRYDRLFADGVLKGVIAVGFDEVGSHLGEQEEVVRGLAARGFVREGDTLTREFERDGKKVKIQLELITPDQPNAKERFARGMRTDELVLYGGHGRYGSGPDFDDIHSPAGNFVIGAPFEAGHVTLGANDLTAVPLTPEYQLMFFDGCNTFRYFDDLRAKSGKTIDGLDVVGSNTELYWSETAENLLAALDAVSNGEDLEQLMTHLDAINRMPPGTHAFRPDGFD
ncbi:MAG: peptidoglycan-binding domain-containing protein [Archangium sp.]